MIHCTSFAPRALMLSSCLTASFSVFGAHAEPEATPKTSDKASNAELESQIETWLKGDEQKRPLLTSNAILSRVARARATDMGRRNYFSAVTPEGIGPNSEVTQAGYVLPDFYDKSRAANNVLIYAGAATSQAAWQVWMKSPKIRDKIFGLFPAYARQTQYGIGHAYIPNSQYKHYWVLLIAEPGQSVVPKSSSKTGQATANSPISTQATKPQEGKPQNVSKSGDADLENQIATLIKGPGQKRLSLTFNPILARVARERATDMGQRNYFGHTNPDGVGPNFLVTQAGYVLPAFYNKERAGNSIESITSGADTPAQAWDSWMHSPPHREHILGLSDFYAQQIEYGVGHAYFPNSQYKHYWVIITAKPGP